MKSYKTSKNYSKLFDLVMNGGEIIIDGYSVAMLSKDSDIIFLHYDLKMRYDEIFLNIAKINEEYSPRYYSHLPEQIFIERCKERDIEYLEPTI